ncbi:MAG TPA: ATP-binding cassette domain-containing protein [Gammaproteobacteria bacterium]|nr:ATP-binding cassette domain-containing protein [Gammaproteobacteria bacterium]
MALITLREVVVSFGGQPLLDGLNLQIDAGERVCLVGRNGAGKSTLMKVLAGKIIPDDGQIERQQGLVVTRLKQEVPHDTTGSVYDVVADGLGKQGEMLSRYHHASQKVATDYSDATMAELERAQHALEACDGWDASQRVDTMISRLELPADDEFSSLSGGLKRRVLLAQALVLDPDLLLLDEPTNHLDIEAINWMEEFLLNYKATLLFVTHDRMLLQHLATRIIDLDRGRLTSWPGNYATYLERKEAALEAEESANALFDKKLAEEEKWIRKGIKARRTRNEGRVRALKALRQEHSERRNRVGTANIKTQAVEASGKIVIELEDVCQRYGDKNILENFSATILRGDKIGIIGPNGAGKSTLLKILLGKLEPQQGSVKLGTKLEIAYFDQHRAQLDAEKTVIENIGDGSDEIIINGQPRHVISYMQDFLFSPQRARTPVKALSGGERNRLLLAKLFTKPANMLVMDEPTNDLDVETLELLEELLIEYKGTLLLVSHDRAFINNVVTDSLVFEGDGQVNSYVGGYDDWLRQRKQNEAKPMVKVKPEEKQKKPRPAKKLSYNDQRELDELPKKIEVLDGELEQVQQILADPELYQEEPAKVAELNARMAEVEAALSDCYKRWEALDELQGG